MKALKLRSGQKRARAEAMSLLDCGSHDSARNTCSPLGLTCSGRGAATALICSVVMNVIGLLSIIIIDIMT